jgi:endonuclease
LPIYPKSVRELMHEMAADMKLQPGQVFVRDQVLDWFQIRYPLIKEGTIRAHLMRMSINAPSRIHHKLRQKDDDLFFQLDGSRFRLYEPASDPAPIRPGADPRPELVEADETPQSPAEASQFAYEHDLRDYLARNLGLIEPGLRLYDEEGITGIEFPAGGRFIDILAVDRDGGYVVVELKVSKGYDRVIGQLLRYMGWIEKNQADAGQRVRGVVVAKDITEDLRLACARIPDVRLFEYQLSVTLKPVGA